MADATIVMEDALLVSMAGNTSYLKEFPFLAALRQAHASDSRCGRCGSKPGNRGAKTMLALKGAFASLSAAKADKLKQMLGAKQIVIKYKDRRGQSAERTL